MTEIDPRSPHAFEPSDLGLPVCRVCDEVEIAAVHHLGQLAEVLDIPLEVLTGPGAVPDGDVPDNLIELPEPAAVEAAENAGVGTVENLADVRLAALRRLEGPLDDALANFRATVEEHKPKDDEFRAYEWHRLDDDFVADEELEAAGLHARGQLEGAAARLVAVQAELSAKIGEAVATGSLMDGDEVRSPNWERRLIVARKFEPLQLALSEVTLTEDGGDATTSWHNPKLDADGQVVPDGTTPVRFERWCQNGLRVGGWVHPLSRGPVEVDS